MPTSTVNWLWIGNIPRIDSTAGSNVTQTQLNTAGMTGYTVTGPSQISPVAVTGDTTLANGAQVFTAPFNAVNGFTTRFSFDSPSTTGVLANQTIQTAFRADMLITLPDGTTSTQVATILQMSNGDVFLRPNPNFLPAWDGINALRSLTITQATPFAQNTVFNSVISFNPSIFDIEIPCFAATTLILTPKGSVAVGTLRPGDVIATLDNGMQTVRWVGSCYLDSSRLALNPQLRPIRIAAGALGNGCPDRDLVVSPQHRILVTSRIAQRMFAAEEVLVAAKHLIGLPGIAVAEDLTEVTYVHFMCDRHEVVFAEGAPTESLYPGPMALRALGDAATQEIFALFPSLRDLATGLPRPIRPLVKGRDGRNLAERHLKSGVYLQAA